MSISLHWRVLVSCFFNNLLHCNPMFGLSFQRNFVSSFLCSFIHRKNSHTSQNFNNLLSFCWIIWMFGVENSFATKLYMFPFNLIPPFQGKHQSQCLDRWMQLQFALEALDIASDEAKGLWAPIAAIYHLGAAGVSTGKHFHSLVLLLRMQNGE